MATKVEGNGKVFPSSDRAVDVVNALVGRLDRTTAEVRLNSGVVEVADRPGADGFAIRTNDAEVLANRVVVAVGGQSYPGAGTAGDGYAIARKFGHSIVEPRPALGCARAVGRTVVKP